MSDCKVTIGIPVYNEIKFIEKTLRTAVGQADEIVLSDNASTDGTSRICREYAARYPHIRYIRHEENQGAEFNFNYVLEQASHDYFMWLGGHDFLPSNYVKALRHILDTEDVVLAYANTVHLSHEYDFERTYVYRHADGLLSQIPAERVLYLIDDQSDCTMLHGLHRKSILIQAIRNAHDEKYNGIDVGILGEIAFQGRMMLCNDLFYRRLSPPANPRTWKERRVYTLRRLHGDAYDESIRIPEMIEIGITYVLLRTAKKAAESLSDKEQYMDTVRRTLLRRYGVTPLARTYMTKILGI